MHLVSSKAIIPVHQNETN